jgi:spermidine synthase
VLGLGAGTVVRVFEGENVDAEFIGVELDPVIVELGQQFFGCEAGHGLTVWSGLDARVALRIQGGPFDQIILDCYANQVEIPHHLCTTEFFQEVRARLSVGGWLSANLGGFDFDDAVVSHVAATCSRAFGAPVLLVRVPLSRNYVLMARRDGALPVSDGILHDAIRPSSLALGPRRLPAFSRIVDPRGDMPVLTDDWCPIEILQLRSLTESRKMRRAQVDQ